MNASSPTFRLLGFLAGLILVAAGVTWVTQTHRKASLPAHPAGASVAAAAPGGPRAPASAAGRATGPSNRVDAAPLGPEEAGMVVGIDPETGKIGAPTREQREELDQMAASQGALPSRSTVGLVEERRPDGTVHVDLEGRFQEYATVRIGPDGRKTFGCVDDTTGFSKGSAAAPSAATPPAATPGGTPSAPAREER